MSADRSDEELLAAYQRGDAAAFRVLVERHHGPIYRFCLRALRSPEAAADATQEVFLRVVKNAPDWTPRARVTTWLYTIARNHCIDEARKGRFRRTESLDTPLAGEVGATGAETRLDRVPSDVPAPDRTAHGVRLRKAIDAAVAALPEEQRDVFLLREVGGLPFREIAEATGVGENTIKSRMRYALMALQRALRAQGFTEGPDPPQP